jgi:phosphate starvation-inducible PhoH-like protein
MKKLLTRLGANSKRCDHGGCDTDRSAGQAFGLVEAIRVLKNIKGIETVHLTEKDVVRHRLIQDIIKAYDRYYEHQNRDQLHHKRRES